MSKNNSPAEPHLYAKMLGVAIEGLCSEHLPPDCPDREFVSATLRNHVLDSIHKYAAGYLEHGGSILDRNVCNDTKQEIIDMMFYVNALIAKIERIYKARGGV